MIQYRIQILVNGAWIDAYGQNDIIQSSYQSEVLALADIAEVLQWEHDNGYTHDEYRYIEV